jgi:hypothetical protein
MKTSFLYSIVVACLLSVFGCNRVSKYAIDDPARVRIDNTLLGKWILREDTSKTNYFLVTKKDDFKYFVTYMNQGGTHVQYENFEVFLSKVNNARFLNVQYYYKSVQGYFFLKLLNINESGDEITTATVADSTLYEITKPAEVRARITRNLENPAFFADTAHFYKVKGF